MTLNIRWGAAWHEACSGSGAINIKASWRPPTPANAIIPQRTNCSYVINAAVNGGCKTSQKRRRRVWSMATNSGGGMLQYWPIAVCTVVVNMHKNIYWRSHTSNKYRCLRRSLVIGWQLGLIENTWGHLRTSHFQGYLGQFSSLAFSMYKKSNLWDVQPADQENPCGYYSM